MTIEGDATVINDITFGGNVVVKDNPDRVMYVPAADIGETLDIDTKEDLAEIEKLMINKKTGVQP